ncbi:class I SAM-dependent methyltransferase [Halotalea alkalilenta]|uniref:Methyltransferase n=1 Tax=Halotalea alkalilenta TaxID=376489 RepID=A0A172YDM2_9GAMM|nr:class I SAM-dependent methyltransferase [Halotalea alkalilenta]ANF57370.1 hypothetical protein A5892_07750 [Halotalea alkalilenta]
MSERIEHFDRLYRDDADPWQVEASWYERRKRALVLAALPRERYRHAFEPGCGNGAMTRQLAQRCDTLLAADFSAEAVAIARETLATSPHVQVERLHLPEQWPAPGAAQFDLILVSELAYYLDDADLACFISHCVDSLNPAGDLVLCHWRHPFDDRRHDVESMYRRFDRAKALSATIHHIETDFQLGVWQRSASL